jgi:hypothetical protein
MSGKVTNLPIMLARPDVLTHFDKVRHELELATTVNEVKTIRDQAEALRQYARQQKLSLELQNGCAEIKIRAERRAGAILLDMDKNQGGKCEHKSYLSFEGTCKTPTLSDLGLRRSGKLTHLCSQKLTRLYDCSRN